MEDRETVQISEMGTQKFDSLVRDICRTCIRPVTIPPITNPASLPAFSWDERDENQQWERYLAHLQRLKFEHAHWMRVTELDFLATTFRSGGGTLKVTGNTDVALVLNQYARSYVHRLGALLLVELKKPGSVDKKAVRQTITQLLCQAISGLDHAPVALLTDLQDEWHFFWVREQAGDRPAVHLAQCARSTATSIIQRLFGSTPDSLDDIPELKARSVCLNLHDTAACGTERAASPFRARPGGV